MKTIPGWLLAGLLCLPALAEEDAVMMKFPLRGVLDGRLAGRPAQAVPGVAARWSDAEDGGMLPGAEGAAISVKVEEPLWGPRGTVSFLLRPARTLRTNRAEVAPVRLLDCPALRVTVQEQRQWLRLDVHAPAAEESRMLRRVGLSRLEGHTWYHLAFAWDAAADILDLYLNGVLQEKIPVDSDPWTLPERFAGDLHLGGTLGSGPHAAALEVAALYVFDRMLDAEAIAAQAAAWPLKALSGEGRTLYGEPLDLSPYHTSLIYDADFSQPLKVLAEQSLFTGDERGSVPAGYDWVLEGAGRAWSEQGRLVMQNEGHTVLWNTRVFPADFLLEFEMMPADPEKGLAIVFFNARGRGGQGVFDPGLPLRDGLFQRYHSGELDNYHVSYWSGGRRTSNLRKNSGFYLTTVGNDRITGAGPGLRQVRLLKVGHTIRLAVDGKTALLYQDDGETYGPVIAHDGMIGLRQMRHTGRAEYGAFRVWKVEAARR